MAVFTVSIFQGGGGSVNVGDGTLLANLSVSAGTLLANLSVSAGRGPKGDGFTGVTYNTETGRFVFTSNDGLGFTSDDITVDLNAAVVDAANSAANAAASAASINPDSIAITGGTIDGTVIGGTAPSAGSFTNVTINDLLTVPRLAQDTIDDLEAKVSFGSVVFNSSKNELNLYDGVSWISLVSAGAFDVATDLFSAGETGVYIDPNDISTLFQDTAGTVPVTTPGQTVARVNDKSGNGNHATQATAAARPTYGIVPETGRRNLLPYRSDLYTENTLAVTREVTSIPHPLGTPNGQVVKLTATLGEASRFIHQPGTILQSGTVSDIVKSEGIEYVAYGRRSIDGQGLNVFDLVTGTIVRSSFGTNVPKIEALGDGWYRIATTNLGVTNDARPVLHLLQVNEATGNYAEWTGDGTGILVAGRQLDDNTLTNTTPYQRVGTRFDVTEAGVPSLGYLSFDGVDDFLVTPTIAGLGAPFLAVAGVQANGLNGVTQAVSFLGGLGSSGNLAFLGARLSGGPVGQLATGVRQGSGTQTTSNTGNAALSDLKPHVATGGFQNGFVFARTEAFASVPTARSITDTFSGGIRLGQVSNESVNIFQAIYVIADDIAEKTVERAERYVASRTAEVTL